MTMKGTKIEKRNCEPYHSIALDIIMGIVTFRLLKTRNLEVFCDATQAQQAMFNDPTCEPSLWSDITAV